MKKTLLLLASVVIFACKSDKKTSATTSEEEEKTTSPFAMGIEVVNSKLSSVLDTTQTIEVIAEGYVWSEGPLWLPELETLLWSDVPKNTIYSWKEGEKAKVYLSPSGFTQIVPSNGEGSNGLVLTPGGKLLLCQHGDRRVAYMDAPLDAPVPNFTVIADNYMGKKFNSPNDAAFDNAGNLFFTDPPYGLTDLDASKDKELSFNGVYKVDIEGKVSLQDSTLTKPNGIAFSPDFKKCYVANSDPEKAIWKVYDVTDDKNLINGRLFFDATNMVKTNKGLPDGLKVAKDGTVFATGPGGVLVFSAEGEHLGTINTNQATANCGFNADETVLFMTAHSYVMKLKLK